jgi:hypothetical protein
MDKKKVATGSTGNALWDMTPRAAFVLVVGAVVGTILTEAGVDAVDLAGVTVDPGVFGGACGILGLGVFDRFVKPRL